MRGASRDAAAKALERADGDIYAGIDRKRFLLIRKNPRTVLTTIGVLRFVRRYYYDAMSGAYVYPLDNLLGLPKYSRYSNELRLRVLDLASDLTYEKTGSMLSDDFSLAKSTVWRIVSDARIAETMPRPFSFSGRIHVQIDEKYVGVAGKSGKRRFMTATAFTGKAPVGWGGEPRFRLLNRTMVSSYSVAGLAKRLNEVLRGLYSVTLGTEVYLSGDLALYIRGFPERITCCRAVYVPDRWHVCRFLSDSLGMPVKAKDVRSVLDSIGREDGDLTGLGEEAMKVVKMHRRDPKIFDPWDSPEYLGCCQEGMNSHYYCPRFGKYANRFSPATLEKLAVVKEARENRWGLEFLSKGRRPVDKVCLNLGRPYEDPMRYDIDTSGLYQQNKKFFDQLRYGGLPL
jgi:hypothetical protein